MEQGVEKFDPSKLMDGVRDRIKATFVSLIPEEQWETLVKKEVLAFFEEQKEYVREVKAEQMSTWSSSYKTTIKEGQTSPFRAIVWDFCREETTKFLKTAIVKEYFDYNVNESGEVKQGLKKLIDDSMPGIILNFFRGIAESSTFTLRNQIMNGQIHP